MSADTVSGGSSAGAVERQEWDVIIVGTGMGGATLGYALARAGKQVLFCEKGRSSLRVDYALRGNYAETFFPHVEAPQAQHRDLLTRAGRYSEEIIDMSSGAPRRFIPLIGCGTGGSTALYGMALERFHPSDFTPRRYYPDAKYSTVPEQWPITYEQLLPYYHAAEQLYGVRQRNGKVSGTTLHPANQELWEFLKRKGLHPRCLPSVTDRPVTCLGCQGYLCANGCKHDAAQVCLRPALEQHGSVLLDECEVIRLDATRTKVTAVRCRHRGQEMTVRANVVVLGAGALETPLLLLNSCSTQWPDGLANQSGLVGRNLMRHFIDLYAIRTRHEAETGKDSKEFAFDDWYVAGGTKFGTVQSFGDFPHVSVMIAALEQQIRAGRMSWLVPFFGLARPALGAVLGRLSRRLVLASIIEDLPYAGNRIMLPVAPQKGHLHMHYRLHAHEAERIRAFRQRVRDVLKPYRVLHIKDAENNLRLAHACGTCRFGVDPQDSVLDAANKAHGLANLYVVDSSFFPSSGGTNPSLTIAANALRVADHLLERRPNAAYKVLAESALRPGEY